MSNFDSDNVEKDRRPHVRSLIEGMYSCEKESNFSFGIKDYVDLFKLLFANIFIFTLLYFYLSYFTGNVKDHFYQNCCKESLNSSVCKVDNVCYPMVSSYFNLYEKKNNQSLFEVCCYYINNDHFQRKISTCLKYCLQKFL
jgi:hypothetical protein